SAKPANCFARGFVHLTADNRKWHRQRKYRVPRLHRRLPKPASAYSELHVFVLLARSSTLWNEARAAGLHYFVKPLSGLNSIDFIKRVFRKSEDVEILPRAGRGSGRGKQSRATLHRPSQQHLCWRLFNSCGNCRNNRIFNRPWSYSVTQWRKRQKRDVLLFAEFQK